MLGDRLGPFMTKPITAAINTHRDLIVWQKAMDLVLAVYTLTENFPRSELYGLTSQMRRSAVSIPSNIAEGRMRGTRKDYRQFLIMARSSGAELGTQIEIVKRLPFGNSLHFSSVDHLLEEVMKMLNTMVTTLERE